MYENYQKYKLIEMVEYLIFVLEAHFHELKIILYIS